MGKTYLANEVLFASDLNASFSELVNTSGTYVFTGSHTWNGLETFNANVYANANVYVTSRLGVGTATPSSPLTVVGIIESTTGGIKFPDSSIQATTAAPKSLIQTTAASLTVNIAQYDNYVFTSLSQGITINASTLGSPINGDKLIIRFKDNGTSRAINWVTSGTGAFRSIIPVLPSSTTANKVTYVGCIYNTTESCWDVVASQTQP